MACSLPVFLSDVPADETGSASGTRKVVIAFSWTSKDHKA